MRYLFASLSLSISMLCATSCSSDDDPKIGAVDVYILGKQEQTGTVKYWKNQAEFIVYEGDIPHYPIEMAVSGDDVLVLLRVQENPTWKIAYWKNGNEIELDEGGFDGPADATGLFVSGNDVYVSATLHADGYHTACYWKNDEIVALTNGVHSFATDIFVSGADVYVLGSTENGACYWKNGIQNDITLPEYSFLNSIYVEGNEVFASGSFSGKPGYWRNGNITELSQNNGTSHSVSTHNGDIIVGGTRDVDGILTGAYWINSAESLLYSVSSVVKEASRAPDNHVYAIGTEIGKSSHLFIDKQQKTPYAEQDDHYFDDLVVVERTQ